MFRSRRKNKLYQHERATASVLSGIAYKSGLEASVASQLSKAGCPFQYEALKVPYSPPAKTYNPDFLLTNGIIVETKGFFEAEDRSKMRYVKAQHPALDIRFVFYSAQARIAKKSKTTYAMWAEKQGFKWANRSIPKEWLTETPNRDSLLAIKALLSRH